eukprot:13409538-Alexandrium_andersonii.AAC.1
MPASPTKPWLQHGCRDSNSYLRLHGPAWCGISPTSQELKSPFKGLLGERWGAKGVCRSCDGPRGSRGAQGLRGA